MTPLVSVIVPCFNAAPWLGEAIESVLAQTHPAIETIVVDDGSTDESVAVARRYAPRGVQVVTQPNRGASAARNHGLRLARGAFIQYLDADDLLSPRKLEIQLARLREEQPRRLATCRWGRFETDAAQARFVDDEVFRDFHSLDWMLLHSSAAKMMHPAAWLVPLDVAQDAGPWNETLSLNDDGEYFARVVLASSGIAFAAQPEASTYYRSGIAGSLSRRRSTAACVSLHRSAELLESHLLSRDSSATTRQALADHWQYIAFELYPDAPGLSLDAEARSTRLGGSAIRPPLGPRAALFSRVFGWRLARLIVQRLAR